MIKTVKKNLTCLIISPDFFEKRDGSIKKKVKWEFSTLKLKVEKKKKTKLAPKVIFLSTQGNIFMIWRSSVYHQHSDTFIKKSRQEKS